MVSVSDVSTFRGPLVAPGVSPCFRADDDPHALTFSGRAVRGEGREKQIVNPAWNRRVLEIGGRNLWGWPNYIVSWGWNHTRIGTVPRFPHCVFQWLLLRWHPAEAWGSKRAWYAPRLEDGEWSESLAEEFREPWPSMGDYEIDYAFPKGTPYCPEFIEDRLLRFVHRDKLPSAAQRMKDHRAELEAEEQALWQRDYDHFTEATRAFNAAPFVGYGKKSGQRKRKSPPSQVMTPQLHEQFKAVHAGRMARWKRQQVEGV